MPPVAALDRGGTDWERALIAAARERGFLWRTEETYREWGARFAKFLGARSPSAAEAGDVAEFLSHLAVELRASPSTQKESRASACAARWTATKPDSCSGNALHLEWAQQEGGAC